MRPLAGQATDASERAGRASHWRGRTRLDVRAGGVLLHPTSLPGPHGSGDLGAPAHAFVDWLAAAGQSWWQMLPVGPVGRGGSPYASPSAFAGSPWLVSLARLGEEGWLGRDDLHPTRALRTDRVDWRAVARFREPRLRRAFAAFERRAGPRERAHLVAFREQQAAWLDDWTLYSALRRAHGGAPWTAWERGLRMRDRAALERARRALAEPIRFHAFVQHQFARQWAALRAHARRRGVRLMGDVPIFVAHESADAWAHPEIFDLDARGLARAVAGVPPDYFSATGQVWGAPLYRWEALARRGYAWWIDRLRVGLARFDAARLDHFIGFVRTWAVPAGARTAARGRWVPGPGARFFRAARRALGRLPLVAEDLGLLTPEVDALRDALGLPGMRVLQFAFGDGAGSTRHLPESHPRHAVVYTGTHDNDTTVGWLRDLGGRSSTRAPRRCERARVLAYLRSDGRAAHRDFVRATFASRAALAIVPAQDLLGLGSEARMNRPGRARGCWRWRLRDGALDEALAEWLAALALATGRTGRRR